MRLSLFGVGCLLMACVIVSVAPPAVGAAEPEAAAPAFVVVHIDVADQAEVELLDQFIDIWAYHARKGVVDAAVDAEGEQVLRDFGFRYEIDDELTEKYSKPAERLKDQTEGIPGYPCYRTVEETLATGAALAAAYPDLAEWIDIGDSWEKTEPGGLDGYDLMVRMYEHTKGLGVEIKEETVTCINKTPEGFVVESESGKHEAKAVVLATGTERRKLGVPGEKEFTLTFS